MRIGVITLPLNTNYGGILQAYALQKVLTSLGHDVKTIDFNRIVNLPQSTKYLIYLKRAFLHYVMKKDIAIKPDVEENNLWKNRTRHTSKFVEQHIKRFVIKNISQIKENDFDCFVVGSDQIWRHIYNNRFPGTQNAFLAFAESWDVKRIAYAASFGTDKWEYSQEDTFACAKLAKRFDAISVRESSAVNICKEKLGVETCHLIDPTMLLEVEEYISLFQEQGTPQSTGNLMCYILDSNDDTSQIINDIAKYKNLVPFYTNSRTEDNNAPIEERIQPPVETWLRGFYDAEFVVTDSFHACVFSILFKKPFVVYGNKDRGMARFTSLLQMFGLTDRLVETKEEAKEIATKAIDWNNVHELLQRHRKKAFEFLYIHLKEGHLK